MKLKESSFLSIWLWDEQPTETICTALKDVVFIVFFFSFPNYYQVILSLCYQLATSCCAGDIDRLKDIFQTMHKDLIYYPFAGDDGACTHLTLAITHDRIDIVKFLLNRGADLYFNDQVAYLDNLLSLRKQ